MAKRPSLFGNGIWLIAATGLENLGLLILNFALIRSYGAESHGRFVYYISVISLIRLVCDAGIGAAMVKRIGEGRNDPVRMLGRGIFLAALCNLPFILLIWFRPELFQPSGAHVFAFFALWLAVLVIQNVAVSVFNGLQAMNLSFLVSLTYETAKIGSVIYLVLAKPAFESFLRQLNLALFASGMAIAALLFLRTRAPRRPQGPIEPVSATLRLALLLWVPNAAVGVLSQLLPIAIKIGLSDRNASYYNAIASWSMAATVVLTPAAGAFFAWTARGAERQAAGTGALPAEYFRTSGTIALAFTFILLACKDLILRCYGQEYSGLQTTFGIFILAQLAEYPRYFTTPMLSGGAHAKAAMLLELGRVATVLIATLAAMLLGRGLLAVAMSVLAAQSAFGLLRILHVRKYVAFSPMPGFVRILGAGTAGLALVSLHWPMPVNLALLLAAFSLCGGVKASDFRRMARLPGWE